MFLFLAAAVRGERRLFYINFQSVGPAAFFFFIVGKDLDNIGLPGFQSADGCGCGGCCDVIPPRGVFPAIPDFVTGCTGNSVPGQVDFSAGIGCDTDISRGSQGLRRGTVCTGPGRSLTVNRGTDIKGIFGARYQVAEGFAGSCDSFLYIPAGCIRFGKADDVTRYSGDRIPADRHRGNGDICGPDVPRSGQYAGILIDCL